MTEQKSAAERLEAYRLNMRKPPTLTGQNAVSAAAGLLAGGKKVEFVATGRGDFTVSHPTERRSLQPGERFTIGADEFAYYVKALELGRIMPSLFYDAAKEYEQQRAIWDERLAPAGAKYADALKQSEQADQDLLTAEARLKAARERRNQAHRAAQPGTPGGERCRASAYQ